MKSEDIELITRLAAVEYVLSHTAKILFISIGLDVSDLDGLRKRTREALAEQTFPGLPAPWSDHCADELAGEVDRILEGIQSELVNFSG